VILRPTSLPGAFVVELEPIADERGSFARTFDAEAFAARGMDARVAQTNQSQNRRAGTLRGLHLQTAPHGEAKLVRCTRGAVHDVLVDLRPDSATFRQWFGLQLDARSGLALFAPEGVAHGFQTLVDDTDMSYQMSTPYVPSAATGVRWDDPAFAIEWPDPPPSGRTISPRDRAWPDFTT
jgi:dTDP-4-dehydrorhamnose 3,5-epimerase